MIIHTTLGKLRNLGYGFVVDSFVRSNGPRQSDYKKVKLEVVAESGDCYLTKVSMKFSGIWDAGNDDLTVNYEDFDFFKVGSDVPFEGGYGVGLLVDKKHFRVL